MAICTQLENDIFARIFHLQQHYESALSAMLKPHGLSPLQYNVLRILRGAGKEGLPSQRIGERIVHRSPDVTRLLDRLCRDGLTARIASQSDRRIVLVTLSTHGTKLLRKLDGPFDRLVRDLLAGLSTKDLASLGDLLGKACRNFDLLVKA